MVELIVVFNHLQARFTIVHLSGAIPRLKKIWNKEVEKNAELFKRLKKVVGEYSFNKHVVRFI